MTSNDGFDSWFRRLKAASKRAPAVRAVSISRFILSYPRDRLGAEFYFSELGPELLRALADPTFRLPDPEFRAEVQRALDILATSGFADEVQVTAARAVLHFEPLITRAKDDRGGSSVQIYVPVVQQVVDRDDAARTYVGVIVPVRVYPAVSEDERPPIRYLGRANAEESVEPIMHVAHRALRCAHELAPRVTLLAWLEAWIRGSRRARQVFDISLGDEQAPIGGPSAGLALAVAFLGAVTGHRRAGRGFRPSKRLAWTGAIDDGSGCVTRVTGGAWLRAKVRAAYFEGFNGIVVPWEQLPHAEAAVPPSSRPFVVHGVERLEDVVRENSLVAPWRMPASLRRPRRREPDLKDRFLGLARHAVAAVAVISLVNSLWGQRTYIVPGTDRRWILILQHGIRLPLLHHDQTRMYFHRYSSNLAGEPSGAARLVVLREFSGGTSRSTAHPTQLEVYAVPPLPFMPLRRIWWYDFLESGLPFEPLRQKPTAVYGDAGLEVCNIDGVQGDDIIAWTPAHPWSSTLISVWNGEHYPVAAAVHPGSRCESQFEVNDLDGDGTAEIVTVNHGNARGGTSVLIMDFDDFCPTDAAKLARRAHGYVKRPQLAPPNLLPQPAPAIAGPGPESDSLVPRVPSRLPPARVFDQARQPCRANFIIPVPDSIRAINPTDTFQTRRLSVFGAPPVSSAATFSIWALPTTVWLDHYLVTVALPNRMAPIICNAPAEREAKLLGHPYLSTPAFLRAWRQSCRVYDHICWSEADSTGTVPEEF